MNRDVTMETAGLLDGQNVLLKRLLDETHRLREAMASKDIEDIQRALNMRQDLLNQAIGMEKEIKNNLAAVGSETGIPPRLTELLELRKRTLEELSSLEDDCLESGRQLRDEIAEELGKTRASRRMSKVYGKGRTSPSSSYRLFKKEV